MSSPWAMVFIVDEGSVFKAPLQKVWQLGQSEGIHNHPSMMNVKRSMEGEHVVLVYDTKMPDGNMAKNKVRMTVVPPVGFILEYMDGPFTGTRLMQYYIPKGDKTGVTVVGEVKSPMIPESQLKGTMLKGLEMAFNEDQENLKKL